MGGISLLSPILLQQQCVFACIAGGVVLVKDRWGGLLVGRSVGDGF